MRLWHNFSGRRLIYYISSMKTASRAAISSVSVVLFVIGSVSLVRAHPEVQFAFYIPAATMIIYAVIRDSLFSKPTNIRHQLRGK
jgi:hypothetical protein